MIWRLLLARPVASLGALAFAVLIGFAAVQTYRLDATRAERAETAAALRAAQARLVRQAEALAVHRAHVARMQREAASNAETIRFLQALEGADAPLSDAAAAGARRLWGE